MIIIATVTVFFMLGAALSVFFFKDLMNAVVASSLVSLTATVLFYLLQAPDVAMAEAAIGVALVTGIFVVAIRRTERYEK
ncbi:MAG: hydrogenase subunit MbhD domain-containing protein [Candidatus Acetothermia bacterium]|nr:DUF4040 domain-containing protein [Candidatus Bipolaricaulota bacterium]